MPSGVVSILNALVDSRICMPIFRADLFTISHVGIHQIKNLRHKLHNIHFATKGGIDKGELHSYNSAANNWGLGNLLKFQ